MTIPRRTASPNGRLPIVLAVSGALAACAVGPDRPAGLSVDLQAPVGTAHCSDRSGRAADLMHPHLAVAQQVAASALVGGSPTGRWFAVLDAAGTARIWDGAKGRQRWTLAAPGGALTALAVVPRDTGAWLVFAGTDRGEVLVHDAEGGAGVARWRTAGRAAAVTGVGYHAATDQVVARFADGRVGRWTLAAHAAASAGAPAPPPFQPGRVTPIGEHHRLSVTPDGRLLVLDDQRVADAAPVAEVRLVAGGGWAVIDADGRFDGDELGRTRVAWVNRDTRLALARLADLYYEPGLLAKRARDPDAILTDRAPAIGAGIGRPPVVTALAARLADRRGPDGAALAEVTATAVGRGGCIGFVRLFHNGKTLGPAADRVIRTERGVTADGFPTTTVVTAVPLVPGDNRFTAVAGSRWRFESVPVETTLASPDAAPAARTLHVLTIGINRYANPRLELNFAVADARGITAWAAGPLVEPLFDRIAVTELFDADATTARITQALDALAETGRDDSVIIFLSGHGENDGEQWFFLPAEFGANEITLAALAREGIASERLRNAVRAIPAQRVALVIDACKSGDLAGAFRAEADERYLEWVARTAGIHILAATDQGQLATELGTLGHGAFTHALLDGLAGAADQAPIDGETTAAELGRYAAQVLPQLTRQFTEHVQYPTSFHLGPRFVVAADPG